MGQLFNRDGDAFCQVKTNPAGGEDNQQSDESERHQVKCIHRVFLNFQLLVAVDISRDIVDFLGIILGKKFTGNNQKISFFRQGKGNPPADHLAGSHGISCAEHFTQMRSFNIIPVHIPVVLKGEVRIHQREKFFLIQKYADFIQLVFFKLAADKVN